MRRQCRRRLSATLTLFRDHQPTITELALTRWRALDSLALRDENRSMNSFGARRLRIIKWAMPIVLVLSTGLGCGPKDDPSSSSAGSPEEQLIKGLCDGLASCCGSTKLTFDRAGCESQAQLTLSSRKPSSSSKAVLDTAAVTECASQARQAIGQCNGVPKDGACGRIYVGTLATNASCTEDEECAPVSGAEVYCSGVCYAKRRGAPGDICQADCQDASCSPPSVDHTSCYAEDGLVCVNGKCANAPTAGQPCPNGQCAKGAKCSAGNLTCVAEAAIGQACTDAPCVAGSYCDNAVCAAQLAGGAVCTRNAACLSGLCSEFVNNNLTCAAAHTAATWDAAACAGKPNF